MVAARSSVLIPACLQQMGTLRTCPFCGRLSIQTFQNMQFCIAANTIYVKGGDILRTFSLLKGLPVFTITGDEVGRVADICISEHGEIRGIIARHPGIFKRSFFLPLTCIYAFGSEGIVLHRCYMEEIDQPIHSHHRMMHSHALLGRKIYSQTGDELGLLHDVYFSEKMGTIVAYETTDGFFSEITEGRQVYKSNMPPAIGRDAIVISVNDRGAAIGNDEMPELQQ
ncbi:PRC-barrel domain-containing protein [Peribacillus sp. SCS-155]|uniref:PRC-barrel domain-containing protein n=1 Tax=Peribacillus sedimenti TaxID=3115297 RepID=UPI0039058AB9